ncbi:hypothetical protein Arub01_26730 [Actinomadura rubrobrunea]|uniref:Uncharacterized protein n=1 Tax=Actinomadura rubrobrunea TaxID=115335 RepID=A0A9W6UUY2_9ACTN|nr:hypothetical protein [Actinomadura rubrobrunea]GLW64429.1 hypothetical protein Arub01_26730 [Actinomadura rubrobrunea]
MAVAGGAVTIERVVISGRALVLVAVTGVLGVGCGTETVSSLPSSSPVATRPSVPAPASPPGESAPHHQENNAWKYRRALSKEDERLARAAEGRVRSALKELRENKEFSVQAVEGALLGLGYPSDRVQVRPVRASPLSSSATPPPGAEFAVRVGERGCVLGDVRPRRLLVRVEGTTAEGTCLEPPTH